MARKRGLYRSGPLPEDIWRRFRGIIPDENWLTFRYLLDVLWKIEGVDFPAYLAALRLARAECFNKQLRDARLNGLTCTPAIDWLESTHKIFSRSLNLLEQPLKLGARASNLRTILKEGGITTDDLRAVMAFERKLDEARLVLKRERKQPKLEWKQRAKTNLRKAGIPVMHFKTAIDCLFHAESSSSPTKKSVI